MSSRPILDPVPWRAVEAAFERALDCPPEHLDALLDELSAHDHALGREVRTLLEASHRVSFLDLPGLRSERGATPQLDGYAFEHELGRGGMGVVYRATRHAGEPRTVAVKLLDGPLTIHSCFRTERAILSRLDHPNIARVLDGGRDPVPFLVMEYVDGQRIDGFCEANRLSVEARLALFATVCDAVHHAHQNLVIHCDLKPANILVDDAGVPRLLDFGIARLVDGADLPTDATRTSASRPLTVDYASPEVLDGRAPTTASDVYSLGVLLFALLTGGPPFQLDGLGRQEIRQVFERDHPPAPSDRARPEDGTEASPITCGLPPRALSRRLDGDIDSIVRTALRVEARERYASAAEMARDVRRHLDGLPIQARRQSLLYTAKKWVRRHQLAATVLAFALTSTLVFAGTLTVQNAAILRAQAQAQRAYEASQAAGLFLAELVRSALHEEQRGSLMTIEDIVDRGAEQHSQSFAAAPASRAAIELVLGGLYSHLGRFAEAKALLHASAVYWRRVSDSAYEAEALALLGRVHRFEGRHDTARRLLDRALALSAARPEDQARLRSTLLLERSHLEITVGRHAEAEVFYRHSLQWSRAMHGERSPPFAIGLVGLGRVHLHRGQWGSAESLLSRGLDILEQHLGPAHPLVETVTSLQSQVRHTSGQNARVEASFTD